MQERSHDTYGQHFEGKQPWAVGIKSTLSLSPSQVNGFGSRETGTQQSAPDGAGFQQLGKTQLYFKVHWKNLTHLKSDSERTSCKISQKQNRDSSFFWSPHPGRT